MEHFGSLDRAFYALAHGGTGSAKRLRGPWFGGHTTILEAGKFAALYYGSSLVLGLCRKPVKPQRAKSN